MIVHIHNLSYASFSNLVEGLSADTVEALSEHIGESVTWGDSSHTLVDPAAIVEDIDLDDDDHPDLIEFMKRVKNLPRFVYIDMET